MSFLKRLFGGTGNAARMLAAERGVTVTSIDREVPVFSRANKFERLEPARVIQYSLPRLPGNHSRQWALLQRGERQDAALPHGWQLAVPDGGEVQGALRACLAEIAAEWSEEYLEFEATETTVSAYWEESGGQDGAARIIGYLERLVRL